MATWTALSSQLRGDPSKRFIERDRTVEPWLPARLQQRSHGYPIATSLPEPGRVCVRNVITQQAPRHFSRRVEDERMRRAPRHPLPLGARGPRKRSNNGRSMVCSTSWKSVSNAAVPFVSSLRLAIVTRSGSSVVSAPAQFEYAVTSTRTGSRGQVTPKARVSHAAAESPAVPVMGALPRSTRGSTRRDAATTPRGMPRPPARAHAPWPNPRRRRLAVTAWSLGVTARRRQPPVIQVDPEVALHREQPRIRIRPRGRLSESRDGCD